MAKQLVYRSQTNTDYPQSYWRPVSVSFDINRKNVSILFHGFKDKESSDLAKLGNSLPVGTEIRGVAGVDYESLFSVSALSVEGSNFVKSCYELVKDDSFFKGGVDV